MVAAEEVATDIEKIISISVNSIIMPFVHVVNVNCKLVALIRFTVLPWAVIGRRVRNKVDCLKKSVTGVSVRRGGEFSKIRT